MKKNLLILVLFCFSTVIAQNKIANKIFDLQKENVKFTPISVLTTDNSISRKDVEKAVKVATLAKVDLAKINQIAAGQQEFIELEIPYQNQNIKIQLYRVDPFAEDFRIDTDKSLNIPYQKGVYYRGIIKGNSNSVSAFNFFNGEFNGVLSSEEFGNIVVGKIDKPNNQKDYIVYSDTDLKMLNDFECHFKDDDKPQEVSTQNRVSATAKCVTFYFEIDYNLYQSNGSNTTTTANWMTSVFNNVQTLFNNDGITTALKSIYVWTVQDPYHGVGTSSSDYLQAFSNYRPVFNGDVGMLIGIDPGGLGGVAYLNQVCGAYNYSYSDINGLSFSTVPTYSWTIQVVTHEFGHSLGSRHTHACAWNGNNTAIDGCGQQAGYSEGSCATGPIPSTTTKGTIMSYCHLSSVGISFSNGFGPQPATLIANTVNAKQCLSTDCINTCINTVTDIQTINVTETSATITWNDITSTNTAWQISVTPFSSTTSVWNNVSNTPTYSVSGLLPNTYYRIRIRPLCTGITPANREKVLGTAGNYCATMLFTDTGGISNNYSDMESFTRTFTPNAPGQSIRVAFTAFALEADYDYLYIYDGPDENYPEFNFGAGFTGSNSPGTVSSTAPDGSLTFKFFSDQYVTDIGWRATVSCSQTLGIDSNSYIDFSYYPNPTKNNVTLKSNTNITEIEVYNIEGRKLFGQKLDALESSVELSQFATGTYFFKVRFNDKEKNFKIVKL